MLLITTAPLAVAAAPADANEPPIVLPKMKVTIESLEPKWLIPKADLTEPDFVGVRPEIVFPARGRSRGVFDGYATVALMLDADGKVLDQMVIRYTQPYFGDALVGGIRGQTYTPRRVKGVAVPGRFLIGQRFQLTGAVLVTGMDGVNAFMNRARRSVDGPPVLFEPRLEYEMDEPPLQFTAAAIPTFPRDAQALPDEEVRVVVSFFVDENGQARLPNVESSTAPALIPNVIKAAMQWRFVPPTFNGKPALVFAIRSVLLEQPAPENASPAAP